MNFTKLAKIKLRLNDTPRVPANTRTCPPCCFTDRRQYLFTRRLQSKALNLQVIPTRPSHGDPPGLRRARIHPERTYGFPSPITKWQWEKSVEINGILQRYRAYTAQGAGPDRAPTKSSSTPHKKRKMLWPVTLNLILKCSIC